MASKRRIRHKACDGKVRHGSVEAAKRVLWATTRQDVTHQRMNLYRCKFCGGFHIGHSNWRGK